MAQVTPENNKKQWAIKVSEFEENDGVQDVTTDRSNKVFYESLAYAFLIPIFSVLLSSGFTLVPQHDVFAKPEYWYEICIPWASLMASMAILQALRNNVIFKGYEELKSPKIYIKMFLMLCLNINTSLFICHYIWTDYFGCVTPLPFLYTIAFVFAFPGALVIFWFSFPFEFRRDVKTRKRIRWLIVWILLFAIACYERLAIIFLFLNTPQNIQPIWALILPVWREAELWILVKFPPKFCDGDERDAFILTNLEQSCNFSAVLAICLGLYATDTSCYCILAVEFLLKMHICYGISKIEKKLKLADGKEKEALLLQKYQLVQDLALDEFVEVIMPIIYVTVVLVAYYGPNYSILGNIGCEKWYWLEIPDLTIFLTAMFRMFIIDLLAFMATWLILWKFASINFLRKLCHDVTTYWPFVSCVAGGAILKVHFYVYTKLN